MSLFEVVEGKVIVTTSTGWRVECLPYGDDFMRAGSALALPEKPEPPTYRMGEPEEGEREIWVPYTEASIADKDTPEEDRAAWAEYIPKRDAYLAEVAAVQYQQELMRGRVLVYRATRVLDLPDLREWARMRNEFYGIPTPGDERELLFQFFTAEVSKTAEDALKLLSGVLRATGISEEVLDRVEGNFRDTMGRTGGQDAQADQEGTSAAAQDEA